MIDLIGLVVPGIDSAGKNIDHMAFEARVHSAQVLLGRCLDNRDVLTIPARRSVFVSGQMVTCRVFIVYCLGFVDGDAMEALQSAAVQLGRLWGSSVTVINSNDLVSVKG